MTESVPPVEIPLNTYIAVEVLPRMSAHTVAEAIIRGGKEAGTWFRRLEHIGFIEIGMRQFARYRTDLADPMPVLKLLLDRGHGIAYYAKEGFEAQFPVRRGRVNGIGMTQVAPQTKVYKGPKIKGWETAFVVAGTTPSI